MQWLSDLLNKIANFFKDYALYIPKWIWQHILEGIQSVIAAIPVPDAFTQFASASSYIPSYTLWFLDVFEFQYGVTVVIGAMAARFVLKLIPTLGF